MSEQSLWAKQLSLLRRNLWLIVLVCGLAAAAAGPRGLPAREGINNFGKVNDNLYRGAQPDQAGLRNLARLGVKTIVNLRQPGDVWKPEARYAEALGMVYTNIPLSGVRRPKDAQVQQVLAAIASLPGPVFVHCEFGCDRTGTIVACYRIRKHKWSQSVALAEARRYGMSSLVVGMRRYVREFAEAER